MKVSSLPFRISVSAATQTGRVDFAEIPELVFVEGIAETEQLGIYQLDPSNRWTSGDLTNASGWKATTPLQLKAGGTNVGGNWLSYNSTTGLLSYSGAKITGAAKDYSVYLEVGSYQSERFRIRIVRPTHVYGFGAMPTDTIAQYGWTGAVAIDATTILWTASNGPTKQGPTGRADATPRVIFMCGEDFPSQLWYMAGGPQVTGSPVMYSYVLGDPNRRPFLSKVGGTIGRMVMHATSVIWYVKNLSLSRISLYVSTLTSDRKSKTIWHKIRQIDCDSELDALGSAFTYHPYAYPSASRVDATDGSLGTYFHTYITFFEGLRNGSTGNQDHQLYAEGNGTTASFINACFFAGARGCSTLKSIQTGFAVRNSLLSYAPDYDTFASASDPAVPWAAELIDVKGCADSVIYNNEFRIGTGGTGTSQKGHLRAIFFRARKTAMGADVPPYPDLSWDPPVGMDSFAGKGYEPIPGFSMGCETYRNDAFWAAVKAADIKSPTNPYSFKHFVAYNTFRMMTGRVGPVMRDDGTHPVEGTTQYVGSTMLGTHPDWVERAVTFLANNRHLGGYQASDRRYILDDFEFVDSVENGTGNAMRSYFVTWNDGTKGFLRTNEKTKNVRSWSPTLAEKMMALGAGPHAGPKWETVVVPLLTEYVPQPLYPPAKWGANRDLPKVVELGGIAFDGTPTPPVPLPASFKI